jgi:hypothetical protein
MFWIIRTVRSWNADDDAFAGLELVGEVDLIPWAAFHQLDIWSEIVSLLYG